MKILGISAYYHDSAACLVVDGRIVAAAQEERFTRKKHDSSLPVNAVKSCLSIAGLEMSDIDIVAFYEKPFLKFERLLESYLSFAPKGFSSFVMAMPIWLKDKLWMKTNIAKGLGYDGRIAFTEHHEAHAGSAFYPSPFKEAAIITIDGVGEHTTTSYGTGRGSDIELLSEIRFPHSLGLLYSAFTYFTGFKVNSAEYKVMGLAPYGRPVYKQKILDELIDVKEDGSFRLNMDYFEYPVGLRMTGSGFERLFGGPARKPESPLTQREMDLARSVQEVTEEVVLRMARHVRRETGMNRLCMAGGVALNCVANGLLLRERVFDDIWIQPASGDAGGALGAALVANYRIAGDQRSVPPSGMDMQSGSYLGPEFDNETIKAFLDSQKVKYRELTDEDLAPVVSGLIADEKVIGWFQGRMEFGPRALGARSIIGDARSAKMQETMNLKIKFRESFRPFAPAVLIENAGEYFEIDSESPYMLLVANVRENHLLPPNPHASQATGLELLNIARSDIPAVTHVDNSARIQTVDRRTNPRFHSLIERFRNDHGCPVIINTSFNVRGEPIVCTPKDAYVCFMRTNMDYLVLGNFLLDKTDMKPFEDTDWKSEYELD